MITDEEFRRIVTFVKRRTGIELQQKKVLIIGRMENYLIKNGYANYNEYMNVVEKDITGKEIENLVNILTTNHTYFMREFEHMDFLKNRVLPELKKTKAESRDLRIWSAASSTGEEPYTIAMILNDFFGLDYLNWDTTILATDISTQVLQYAAKGQYLKEQIEPLPDTWKKRYFRVIAGDKFEVKPELKKAVLFRQFNLMNPLPFKRKLHVVFMRNVMIYFERETKRELIQRIYDFMEPGGYLFIGTTESIDKDCADFQYICPSVYKK